MPNSPNVFVWYELMTSDMEAAEAYYRDVVGWRPQDAELPDMRYTMMNAGDRAVAGIMTIPPEASQAGARPAWTGYIGVSDVDAASNALQQAGGAVHRAPADIPGVGRFSVVADPQGAIFQLFQPLGGQNPAPPPPMTPGYIGWHELYAGDGRAPSTSMPASSAGPRRRPWTWVRWAPTSCSPPAARPSGV